MKWWWLLGGAVVAGGAFVVLQPHPGFCVETTHKKTGRRCVQACFPKKLAAKRDITQIWSKHPDVTAKVIESRNTLLETSC